MTSLAGMSVWRHQYLNILWSIEVLVSNFGYAPEVYETRVIYYEELPLIKLHNPSITGYCEVTWQTEHYIFPIAEDPWIRNYADREMLPPLKPHNLLIMSSMWGHMPNLLNQLNIKSISQDLQQLTLEKRWVTGRRSASKRLNHHQLLVF